VRFRDSLTIRRDTIIKELESIVKQLEATQKAIDERKQVRQDIDTKQQLAEFDLIDENIKKLEQSKKAQEDYLKSFVGEFASKSGFSETFNILTKKCRGIRKDFITFSTQ
jgi:hypothetical protein